MPFVDSLGKFAVELIRLPVQQPLSREKPVLLIRICEAVSTWSPLPFGL